MVLTGLEDPFIPSPYTIENDSNFVVKFLSRYLVGMYEDDQEDDEPADVALVGAEDHVGSHVPVRIGTSGL